MSNQAGCVFLVSEWNANKELGGGGDFIKNRSIFTEHEIRFTLSLPLSSLYHLSYCNEEKMLQGW